MSEHGTTPDPVPSRSDCRLVSYNVLYQGLGPDGRGWHHRQDAVLDELSRLAPDVIGFQEVWMGQLTDLQQALSEYDWVAATETPAHTPIAYRSKRFEVRDSGTFWLSPPETEPGVPAWDATYQRLATYATFDDSATEPPITVVNVHLDHEGEQARREGISLVRDRLVDIVDDGESVLVGDFNCRPTDPAYRRAIAAIDGWSEFVAAETVADAVGGPSETYTGFPEEDEQPQNIDHILISDGLDVDKLYTCVPPSESENQPSDHRPVLADITY